MPYNSFVDYPMSWRPDRDALQRPLYLSLATMLEYDIINGFLAEGTKLPPQRELADFLDINFTTVTRAYKVVELKGLIYAVTGSGTYVSPNATNLISISKDTIKHECIDLGFVASFEQTNDKVAKAAKKVMKKGYIEELLNYNEPTGIRHHKKAALNWMERLGVHAEPENMAITSGALNALTITLLALFEPGNRIAVDLYTFTNFIELAKAFRIKLIPIQGDAKGMLPEELDYQCRRLDIQGVFLMPSCSNPTTIMIPEDRKEELAEVIRTHRLILLEDDIHAFLSAGVTDHYSKPMIQLLPEQTVYISSISKSICSGLRVAYVVFSPSFRDKIRAAIYNVNVKTSSLDAEIVTELILSGQAHQIVEEKRQLAHSANALYAKFFPESAHMGHPLSFYRWMPLPYKVNGATLEREFLNQGIQVYHSDRFLSGGSMPNNYLRIALSSTNTLEELERGLSTLHDILQR